MFTTIIIFVGVLAVLVLAHEWGHFFAARRLGIGVKEFGFGFPPRLAGFKWRGVLYSLNWLPLGGFVKLKGEDDGDANSPDSFAIQKSWRRIIVLVAGVGMNIIVAWLLLSVTLGIGIRTALDESKLDDTQNVDVQIIGISQNTPAEKAGLRVGDIVEKVDSTTINRITELQAYISAHVGQVMQVTVSRTGKKQIFPVESKLLEQANGRAAIGVNLIHSGVLAYSWPVAFVKGASNTWYLGRDIIFGFGKLFDDLLTKGSVPQDLAGPVGIAVMTGEVAQLGFIYLLQFMALLSLNLAIINILPFPALDGGRVLFVIIEKIIRRPVKAHVEAMAHTIGFGLLMFLVLVITFRDVWRISGGFFGSLFGF